VEPAEASTVVGFGLWRVGQTSHFRKEASCALPRVFPCERVLSRAEPVHRQLVDGFGEGADAEHLRRLSAELAHAKRLAGAGDVIYSDALNHASIVDGCRLSRARTEIYRHGDPGHLAELLQRGGRNFRRRLIVTDSVFSMDGDLAPLPEIVALAREHDALVVVDDAHATGVIGPTGRGSAEFFGLDWRDLDVQMGTLGKALGSFGAYVAGAPELIDYLVNRARSFIYTTALPPAVLAASGAALELVEREPERVARLRSLVATFRSGLQDLGLPVSDDPTPIIPVLVGPAQKTMFLSNWFLEQGVFIQGIRPPTVPEGSSRLRVTLSADLETGDLDRVLGLFAERRRDFLRKKP